MTSTLALLMAVSALHLGFQSVVTLVVYPALADIPADRWQSAHAAHTRRIAPVVGVVYLTLAATCGWTLLRLIGLGGGVQELPGLSVAGVAVALVGAAGAAAATAFGAARTHGRLGAGRVERLVHLLIVQDRWRCASAAAGLVGATAAWIAAASG